MCLRYFAEEEDAGDNSDAPYQPAPGSPGPIANADDSDDDPLDAFMAGIEQQVCYMAPFLEVTFL